MRIELMPQIRMVHWNAEEAKSRAGTLRKIGYQVDGLMPDPASMRQLKEHPPIAVVIDLSRLPSHGRDVGLALREAKSTQSIPIVFVEGEPDKVARTKQSLPDATYTTWSRIRGSLQRAIANPPSNPVVPRSRLDGYSGTPLPKKLGIKANCLVTLIDAPDDFEQTLGDLADGVIIRKQVRGRSDLIIWFAKSKRELERRIERIAAACEDGAIWIAWQKKSSGMPTDLTQTIVRKSGLSVGLVDFKICAIDATWCALKFTQRK